jgi:hypothetical protein
VLLRDAVLARSIAITAPHHAELAWPKCRQIRRGRRRCRAEAKTFDNKVLIASYGYMRLSMAGAELTTECDWALCTVLRDNVQHHLEGGLPSGSFPALHALADRCWEAAEVTVVAAQLRAELTQAWELLCGLRVERMAMGIRSRAALTGAAAVPKMRGTVLLRLTGWKSPLRLDNAKTLGDVLAGLVIPLIDFCRRAGNTAVIAVGPADDHARPPSSWPRNVLRPLGAA